MSKRPKKHFAESLLIGRTWTFPAVGQVRLVDSEPDHWEWADRDWPAARPAKSLNDHWKWKKLMKGKLERVSVLSQSGDILALWCSRPGRPLDLLSGNHYRLDLFEIVPRLRNGVFGALTFALIAWRALELGCVGLVLGAIPGTEGVYLKFGGIQKRVFGWKTDSRLVPFLFDKNSLTYLAEQADEYLDED
jgi:hypothetical protein